MDVPGHVSNETIQVVWEASYCRQRKAEPCDWLPRGNERGPNHVYLPGPDAPVVVSMVLRSSRQGEKQVCEKQGPLVPWLE